MDLAASERTTMTTYETRQAEHDIDPLFLARWSPRAYTGEEIPDSVLWSVLEAARWAPSARNVQPWRFIYAKRNSPAFSRILPILSERNQMWAPQASGLITLVSAKTFLLDGKQTPNGNHSFDAGAAWTNLTLQANILGWHTRAMAAFDHAKAYEVLGVPEDYDVEVIIALGKMANKDTLPADLRSLEAPNSRLPLRDLVSEGTFRK
jgi:nitroreductase